MEKRLSLCMIVKDEESFIGNCLDSVKHVVDEIIIVDTGSTDKTVSICQSYGAKIYEFPWNDSFADARNFGLKQATGDWILWMDADEALDPDQAVFVRDILQEEMAHIGVIRLINYIGEDTPSNAQTYIVGQHRLLRNHMGFQFNGNIHEQLNVQEVLGEHIECKILPVKIHHYGYLQIVTQARSKSERNLRLLQIEKEKPEYSPWIDYHIASEQYRLQRYAEAYESVNTSLLRFIEMSKLPPSLLYKLKYELMLILGSYDGAWPSIEKAIALYPDYVDLHFFKGIILYLKQKYDYALPVFRHCIELGEENLQHLILRGVGSFHAWYYIGQCLERLNQREEAIQAYENCLREDSGHTSAKDALGLLLDPPNQVQQEDIHQENMKEAQLSIHQSAPNTISLCMIVRNEETALERCLRTVHKIVDEIIIVDTGSTDRTKEIAAQFHARVFDFEWIDDFAAARNYAFSQATKEYILWLDADDVLEIKDQVLLKELKKTLSPDVDSVTMHYVLMVDEKGNATSSLRRNRLVKRAREFKWHGPVHEYLEVGGHIIHSDICVTHKKDKQYTDRNLRIYEKRLAAGEEFSPRDLYYFANELRDHSRFEEAANGYAKFLNTGQGWIEDNIQACRKMAECYGKLGQRHNQFMALFHSFTYDKPRAEICCAIGAMWVDSGHYHQAIYWFEQATKLPADEGQMSMVEPSSWTWVPHLQLCVCNDRLGEIEKACYHNEVALSFLPSHPSMLHNQQYFRDKLGEERYEKLRIQQ
ncbi:MULTISPECIES: glycosyltransferase [Paenibacillus]|uniref:glycosyltransferase n=1 Tax=Paenibacillus sp. S-12 TaxID=3031371 RepID=UPI0022817370|nr:MULTISPECIES: glycosyltransferase [Paenibacillus]MCY7485580.1 glycosyltransferase [Paenibacillus alvei]